MKHLARRTRLRPDGKSSPPPAVTAIVVLLLVSAGSAFVGAAAPMTPQAPVRLNAFLAAVGVLLAACTWHWRRPAWQHLSLTAVIAGLGALTAAAASPAGTAALAMGFTWTGAYAAFFFRTAPARGYAAAAALTFGAGLLVNPFVGAAQVWLLAAVTTVLAVETIGRLVTRLDLAATVDPLTGTLNRAGLEREAQQAVRRSAASGAPLSVAVVDLDGFKGINDLHGHAAGDELLRDVAAHWRTRIRTEDVLGRLGGDEFVLVLPGTERAEADELMRRLAADSPAAYSYGTADVRAGRSLEQALRQADQDLYAAKSSRSGSVAVPGQRRGEVPAAGVRG